jgi:monoamine oxidase
MARTPLLSRLQQLCRDFDEAEATGRPVADVQADRAGGKSRRDFLKVATAGAAGAMAWPVRTLAGPAPRIAIVGAGIAGLHAALTLRDAGYASTIHEASNRVGGRMHSDTTSWLNGQVSEHCGELIDTSHKTVLGLAKRFNLKVADLLSAQPVQSTDTYYFFGHYYTRDEANADFNAVYHAVKKDLTAAGYPTLYTRYTQAGSDLDRLSVYDWIETRVPGGHGSRMGQLLDVAYNTEYGAETAEQSSLNLVYLLAYQPVPGNFRIFGHSDERYHLVGGNEGLPKAMAASLPAASIQLNTSLTAIARNRDGTYSLDFRKGPSKTTVVADRVILAVPFSILRRLEYGRAGFNAIKTMAIEQLGYGTNAKLQLQFDSRLWNQPGPWGVGTGTSFADAGYQSTWDVTSAQNGATGILVEYTGGAIGATFTGWNDPAAVQAHAANFLTQLEPVFPGIGQQWNGRATLDTPATNPYLLGSYAYWKVGQYTLFSGAERERSGKCHFAGEHCSIDFQGFMEGGAQEGARAANEILADYKQGVFP